MRRMTPRAELRVRHPVADRIIAARYGRSSLDQRRLAPDGHPRCASRPSNGSAGQQRTPRLRFYPGGRTSAETRPGLRTTRRRLLLVAVVETAAQLVERRGALSPPGRAADGFPLLLHRIRFQVTAVDLAQKAARTRELHIAPLETHLGIGERSQLLGPGQRHVKEPPLLLETVGRLHGPLRRKRFSSNPTIYTNLYSSPLAECTVINVTLLRSWGSSLSISVISITPCSHSSIVARSSC